MWMGFGAGTSSVALMNLPSVMKRRVVGIRDILIWAVDWRGEPQHRRTLVAAGAS